MIGKILGSRYRITKKLGEGGFGKTYLAEDLHRFGTPCIVKHLAPKDPRPNVFRIAQNLFEKEARYLHLLGENNQIPRLYAHFVEDGQFYLVQEYIEGHDLSDEIVLGKRLNEEQTLKLLYEILSALTILHQRNIIHRDLKPQNIRRHKQNGKIVLIDFGAVKEIQELTVNPHGKTTITVPVGTPGYMPSEQTHGTPKLASDIYAVGIIGIQALTGFKPSQFAQNPVTNEIFESGKLFLKSKTGNIFKYQVNISQDLGDVLYKMVRYYFKFRYKNALATLKDLTPIWNQYKNLYEIEQQIPLNSECGIDYTKLRRFLALGEWKEADKETEKCMLQAANRETEGWLNSESIKILPEQDLRTIDELWLHFGKGRFGFSVQKKIYQETGKDWQEFGKRVGWREERLAGFSEMRGFRRGYWPAGIFGVRDGKLSLGDVVSNLLSRQDL